MQENSAISLREMLEQLPAARLSEMMRLELQKDAPDENSVKLILSILEERETDALDEADAQMEMAWERYQERIGEGILCPKPRRDFRWIWLAASAAVIVLMLVAVVPQQAEAEGFWERLDRWKNSILEFFSPSEETRDLDYAFETDNPGLQQVYDEAVELGIDNPLIPMWFEEVYSLMLCQVVSTPTENKVVAEFVDGNKKAVLSIVIYEEKVLHGFCGDGIDYEVYEREGASYRVTRNNDRWVAIWIKDNVEYSLTIDCQEDTLDMILGSIYGTEEQ